MISKLKRLTVDIFFFSETYLHYSNLNTRLAFPSFGDILTS